MKSNIDIVVIHDNVKRESYLITELQEQYNNVKLIDDADDGIEYISHNFSHKTIVVLDMDFGNGTNGFDVLKAIRQYSFLIEVIILSANEPSDARNALTNNIPELPGLRVFDYVIRGNPNWQEKVIEKVNKAEININGSIMNAIDSWIEIQSKDRRKKPFVITNDGVQYSLDQLKKAIQQNDDTSRKLEEKILMMAIKLMSKTPKE
ncbi:response regulator [Flagellimonas pacifica]|uniref:Response regulator receiver domain-containing protein n=1 Tax=Flagellimonas pacifica TaxID=1247520 RepID=A0A285MRW4_9FLAO|nr:response regulator [Allomuricauda parva]SNY99924.1 Response regulator receiver domain-containing protein [Allomuricauda parva]